MFQYAYNLYGGLLRSAQNFLDWKKINQEKVSDNYRLCFSLAMLVYKYLVRLIIFQWMNACPEEMIKNERNGEGIGAISIEKYFKDR